MAIDHTQAIIEPSVTMTHQRGHIVELLLLPKNGFRPLINRTHDINRTMNYCLKCGRVAFVYIQLMYLDFNTVCSVHQTMFQGFLSTFLSAHLSYLPPEVLG